MSDEQAVETINEFPLIASGDVEIDHPVWGKLTRIAVGKDGLVELYRDKETVLFLFFNNLLRLTINPIFWNDAELSVVSLGDVAQIRSAGQPIANIPLHSDLYLQEDFPEGDGEGYILDIDL